MLTLTIPVIAVIFVTVIMTVWAAYESVFFALTVNHPRPWELPEEKYKRKYARYKYYWFDECNRGARILVVTVFIVTTIIVTTMTYFIVKGIVVTF